MGLVTTAYGAFTGAISDLWREFFYCDALDDDTLVAKGTKRKDKRSSNNGADNVISNGSVISIANGQCAIITDNGLISDVCTEPGEFIFSKSSEPSFMCGSIIKSTVASVNKRFAFGGQIPKDQRVYYVNMREIPNLTFGTTNPIMFRVVDQRAGIDIDIRLKICGNYTIKITNPVTFYSNISGNVEEQYDLDRIHGQLKQEFLAALNPALAQISKKGVKYSELMLYSDDIVNACKDVLSGPWEMNRGITIVSIALASVTPFDDDVTMVQELQRNATFTDPRLMQAGMASAQMDAMRAAANNSNGAMTGFMGMNMAMGYGMPNMMYGQMQQPQNTYGYNQRVNTAEEAAKPMMNGSTWTCVCGKENSSDFVFCPKCGSKKRT
jgi:membrane protease subunit (stomatin/prohibitin family)